MLIPRLAPREREFRIGEVTPLERLEREEDEARIQNHELEPDDEQDLGR